MRTLQWDSDAWSDYLHWQQTNTRMLKRINALIKDCIRNPYEGIGKPEPLRGNLAGFWSRRIDNEHRLVYAVNNGALVIIACKNHY